MKSRSNFYGSILLVGLSLGTAWAIRGQFGHEQGAAWAGAIGGLSILLVAKRDDWYNKIFMATLASAFGWGIGGIISYGMVVGYGRGIDFLNVYYGFAMLFVIGSLFGFLGGGLFGLALADSDSKPVRWHQVLIEMTVGALAFYFFLIEEWGWLMTPPRSELWAACLGMAVALTWFLLRNKQTSALRVAIFTGLGAGFGFAFGNFLQVMGNVTQLKFNFWNVMEYSIGFFGGIGLAYGTFTSSWETTETTQKRNGLLQLLALTWIIPFVVWDQSFETKRLQETFKAITSGNSVTLTLIVQWVALLVPLMLSILWAKTYFRERSTRNLHYSYTDVRTFFLGYLSLYILFSFLITGAFLSGYRIEQYLYVLNLLVIALLVNRFRAPFPNDSFLRPDFQPSRWAVGLALLLLFLAIIAVIAMSSHGEMNVMHRRFD